MRRVSGFLLIAVGVWLATVPAFGYLRRVSTTGIPYRWSAARQPVKMVLNQAGANEVLDGSDLEQLEIAMRCWNRTPHLAIAFDVPDRSATTPFAADGKHVVFWDETGAWIQDPTVTAMTRLIVDAGGEILDADVVFNGRDHTWSTDLAFPPGSRSILETALHEFGCVLGLDTSAIGAAALYPHLGAGGERSHLADDDAAGIAVAYPASSLPGNRGTLAGTVTRQAVGVFGAHVVALDAQGVVRGAAVSDTSGAFGIGGLAPGRYTMFAEPLDGPVVPQDLAPFYQSAQALFRTTFLGGNAAPTSLTVTAGAVNGGHRIEVGTAAPTVNLLFVGTAPKEQNVPAYPACAVLGQGEVRDFVVWGTGIVTGSALSFSGGGIQTTLTSLRNAGSFTGVVSRLTAAGATAVGPRAVFVTSPSGEIAALPGFLEILPAPPRISAVSPSSGRGSGGTRVTVQGSGFSLKAGLAVTFGGRPLQALEWLDDRRITGLTPPSPQAGPVEVAVVTGGGADRKAGAFVYGASVVSVQSVTPAHGPQMGGTPVTVKGAGFLDALDAVTLTFGGVAATEVVIVDDSTLQGKTPPAAAAGPVEVKVSNLNGSGSLPAGYVYDPAPEVTAVSPASGPVAGGQPVVVSGSNFTTSAATRVTFGGNAATGVVVANATTLRCDTPAAAAPGPVTVAVSNENGTGQRQAAYTYQPPPTVVSIDPVFGPVAGGTLTTIVGSGFTTSQDTLVLFGPRAATSIQVFGPTALACRTPLAVNPGAVDVSVTNSNGTGALKNGFTFLAVPTVTRIEPALGPLVGGDLVTVTGTGFTTAVDTTVRFGPEAAVAVQVHAPDRLTCRLPRRLLEGKVTVEVRNSGGLASVPNGFEYVGGSVLAQGDPRMGVSFPLVFEGRADGGHVYVAAAAFGNTTGILLDFRTIPLDPDLLFLLSVGGRPSVFDGFSGALDATGRAGGSVMIPVLPVLNGLGLKVAFLTVDANAPTGVRTVSKAASLTIRP